MGWKNVKTAYQIGHTVHLREGRLLIGSPYVSDLISVDPATGVPKWGKLGGGSNADLDRYFREIEADPAKFRQLFEAPDVFDADLPAWTYDGAEIMEFRCEAYGWPNVTHDGQLMHDNSFYPTAGEAAAYALKCARSAAEFSAERLIEKRAAVVAEEARMMANQADVERLQELFPELATLSPYPDEHGQE